VPWGQNIELTKPMKCFKSSWQVQPFLSIHDQIASVFSRRPNQNTAAKFCTARC
jgi:hypothetical protein